MKKFNLAWRNPTTSIFDGRDRPYLSKTYSCFRLNPTSDGATDQNMEDVGVTEKPLLLMEVMANFGWKCKSESDRTGKCLLWMSCYSKLKITIIMCPCNCPVDWGQRKCRDQVIIHFNFPTDIYFLSTPFTLLHALCLFCDIVVVEIVLYVFCRVRVDRNCLVGSPWFGANLVIFS